MRWRKPIDKTSGWKVPSTDRIQVIGTRSSQTKFTPKRSHVETDGCIVDNRGQSNI